MKLVDSPKVSIIVPVYNLGGLVAPCLHSLLEQTYKNIEIIVVDDGSTDHSLLECQRIVLNDSRSLVLRKENGGLSSARNFGLRYASGDYVMFVDGDDILDEHAVEILVNLAITSNSKLTTCLYAKLKSVSDFKSADTGSFEMVSGVELLGEMLLLRGESGSACAKLYSSELFPLLVFPEGQLFEDFGVVAKIFSSVDKACVTDAKLYGYVAREGSITSERRYGIKHLEGMERSVKVVEEIISDIPELHRAFLCFEAFCSLRVASKLDVDSFSDRKLATDYINAARARCWRAARCPITSIGWRARCLIFAFSPRLYSTLYRIYGKMTGKVIA